MGQTTTHTHTKSPITLHIYVCNTAQFSHLEVSWRDAMGPEASVVLVHCV